MPHLPQVADVSGWRCNLPAHLWQVMPRGTVAPEPLLTNAASPAAAAAAALPALLGTPRPLRATTRTSFSPFLSMNTLFPVYEVDALEGTAVGAASRGAAGPESGREASSSTVCRFFASSGVRLEPARKAAARLSFTKGLIFGGAGGAGPRPAAAGNGAGIAD